MTIPFKQISQEQEENTDFEETYYVPGQEPDIVLNDDNEDADEEE